MTAKSRNRIVVIIIIFIIVAAGIWWWRQNRVDGNEGLTPTVEIIAVRIKNISNENVLVELDGVVKNNLPLILQAKNLETKVWLDTLLLIEKQTDEGFKIPSMDSLEITLPMEVKASSARKLLNYLKTNPDVDSLHLKIQSIINLDIPVAGTRTFTIDTKKTIAAVRMPEFSIGKTDIDKFGFNETKLDLQIQAHNLNKTPIEFSEGNYILKIDSQLTLKGTLTDLQLPPNGRDTVATEADIRTLKLGKLTWKYLFDKKDTRFEMRIRGKLTIANNAFNKSDIEVVISGTLKELKDAVDYYSGEK